MPVPVRCPHCHMPCLVAELHRGVPVKCGRCGGTFTTRADPKATRACPAPTPRVRLDIGAAGSGHGTEDNFLVQHLVYCNLEEQHELAVLAAADGSRVISAIAAMLAPLLDESLNGAANNTKAVVETLATAWKDLTSNLALAVIWDGCVWVSRSGNGSIYHPNGGGLNRLTSERAQLAAGDWLILAGGPHPFPDDALQTEIARARSGALEMAERLVEGAGGEAYTFVVVSGT